MHRQDVDYEALIQMWGTGPNFFIIMQNSGKIWEPRTKFRVYSDPQPPTRPHIRKPLNPSLYHNIHNYN